ncbi:MAG: hypothetical protein F9K24_16950 [Leptonema illini]|jgi:hypothetical protein|uniref:TonB C-terminal domain-containing protein n=2 Tax=Leptonema illini TaxID=183 RepID=H2CK28_9LEPT|nr:hypothetical protein [Leptonema illini]EHQ06117.1 hypothetical protein Lepil_1428 [Leptonema illini DSM 21528]KAB2930352.1 MAG: hypothetical protein F9K24_16950 [Leptonema illini]PKL30206.1 MAG: hypothetical protein CVV45_18695 [Spirochaetae bacterium HGW-Spirochaetae-10]
MSSLSRLFKYTIVLFLFQSLFACVSGTKTEETTGDDKAKPEVQGFVEDQPAEPASDDDLFFQKPAVSGELYRVLITGTNYSVRQYGQTSSIQRPSDSRGDKEQLKSYQEIHDEIDFRDWEIEGVLDVRLNPHTGQIEQLQYVPGHNPRTYQAAKLFQEDLTRFRFKFPQGVIQPIRFNVRFRWVIKRRPGLSDEEAKLKAIQYLKSQKQ